MCGRFQPRKSRGICFSGRPHPPLSPGGAKPLPAAPRTSLAHRVKAKTSGPYRPGLDPVCWSRWLRCSGPPSRKRRGSNRGGAQANQCAHWFALEVRRAPSVLFGPCPAWFRPLALPGLPSCRVGPGAVLTKVPPRYHIAVRAARVPLRGSLARYTIRGGAGSPPSPPPPLRPRWGLRGA